MSQITIEIVNVTKEHVPNARGGYEKAKVIYKNKSFQDKVEEKTLISLFNTSVYNKISESKLGDVITIDRSKNEKGFWDWTSIANGEVTVPQTQGESMQQTKPNISPKSTYETPEERATRQKMIVRQSSLSNAIAMFNHKSMEKEHISTDVIIMNAKKFEAYVMGDTIADLVEDVPFNIT